MTCIHFDSYLGYFLFKYYFIQTNSIIKPPKELLSALLRKCFSEAKCLFSVEESDNTSLSPEIHKQMRENSP